MIYSKKKCLQKKIFGEGEGKENYFVSDKGNELYFYRIIYTYVCYAMRISKHFRLPFVLCSSGYYAIKRKPLPIIILIFFHAMKFFVPLNASNIR